MHRNTADYAMALVQTIPKLKVVGRGMLLRTKLLHITTCLQKSGVYGVFRGWACYWEIMVAPVQLNMYMYISCLHGKTYLSQRSAGKNERYSRDRISHDDIMT